MLHRLKVTDGSLAHTGLRIREGYEAVPLAWGSFLLYAVIGCPYFGMIINN